MLDVHAGGIDQPLGLIRMDDGIDFPAPTLIVPHADWRGAYELGTFAFGETSNCHGVWMPASEVVQHDSSGHMSYPAQGSTADVYQDRCMEIDFPGKHMGMTRLLNRPTVAGPVAWMGSLVQDAQDASGLMYRRNRFYDPISGRFTQEDPIGLAGGVNSYGFAEGDPVTYADPYGLKVVFTGETELERLQAERLWNQLAREANEARSSDNPTIRAAGAALATMMRQMWDDPYVYTIRINNDREFISQDGGGLESPVGQGRRLIQVAGEETQQYLTASGWIVLAHELGGAYSRVRGGAHDRAAVAAENHARTIVGCHSRNSAHRFDKIPFDWGNPTCQR